VIKIETAMKRDAIIIFALLSLSMNMNGQADMKGKWELATFGGGCFWCVEAIFERINGVISVESGYSGGDLKNPTYRQVTTGTTGHAEVVQIKFDPAVIGFSDLLEVFFTTHDPTTMNRQGADVGTQYRSIVLYHNEAQRQQAEKAIRELDRAGIWSDPIVTTVEPFEAFYSAEAYHQEYYENYPGQGYCRVVIQPKVEKFEKVFKEILKQP
jgi:peptide-methionine (S)-S-oxide reductase